MSAVTQHRSPFADRRRGVRAAPLFLFVLFSMAFAPGPAVAETSGPGTPESIETLLDRVREEGGTIVVLPADTGKPAADAAASPPARPGMLSRLERRAVRARETLGLVVSELPMLPERVADAIGRDDPAGPYAWPLWTGLNAVVFLLAGLLAERIFRLWSRPYLTMLFSASPHARTEKISYLLFRALLQCVGVAIQASVAVLLAIAFDAALEHRRVTYVAVFAAVAGARFLAVLFQGLFAPEGRPYRVTALSDDDAVRLYRHSVIMLAVAATSGALALWLGRLGLHPDALVLATIVMLGVSATIIVGFAIADRRAVASLILGPGDPASKPLLRRVAAGTWHIVATVYFVLGWFVSSARLLLGDPEPLGLVVAPVLVVVVATAAYGIALMPIERAFAYPRRHGAPDAPGIQMVAGAATPRPDMVELARHAVAIVVVAVATLAIAELWGVNPIFGPVYDVLIVVFLAHLAYRAVKIVVDRKIAEQGSIGPAVPGEEGGGVGTASRLGTLLPLARTFLVVLILAITGMIVLSEIGVDIGPLFAGAGIVGVAIGFGSQTLIKDIFSGAFFLIDDSFRKGEYVEIGDTRGTIEKISVRSMQLRHHMGALHTIPFGEINRLTNYSRDWVMMKLPLRVPYDTDVEKVRKLIKGLGEELLKDPEIGHYFLEPLKSQGVYQMEDSAMIIRVKYMTRPGDQFNVRKKVYSRIRELFEQNGIRFAHREVTVRVADTPSGRPLSEAGKEAIAGAILPVVDEKTMRRSSAMDKR